MRILNSEQIINHGNIEGRKVVTELLEVGLESADPYYNTCQLFLRDGNLLQIGNPEFEAQNDPQSGIATYDLNSINNVYVVGAGKGVQRVAKAIEEVLADKLTGGCVIAKHGDPVILEKIQVIHGAHPVPDEGCVKGCQRILSFSKSITEKDLVFTIIGNGGSSLLTLPVDGVSLNDVKELTRLMQIEKGVTTADLNVIRNHVDQLKGGKIARVFSKAQCVHLIIADANHHLIQNPRHDYYGLMQHNVWLHNLPEGSTFSQALQVLRKYNAYDQCPRSIVDYLENAELQNETVKYTEFCNYRFRVFGLMPDSKYFIPVIIKKAKEMGIRCYAINYFLQAEASACAKVYSSIAKTITTYNSPFESPVLLVSTGEMLVTVGSEKGIGGRNQEFSMQCAKEIAGNNQIVIASVDSDGTDGPGGLCIEGAPICLGGGIVDGYTIMEAEKLNINIDNALRTHSTSEALWKLDCGIHMEQNISLNDLTLIYIL